jgi:hypothetical protein
MPTPLTGRDHRRRDVRGFAGARPGGTSWIASAGCKDGSCKAVFGCSERIVKPFLPVGEVRLACQQRLDRTLEDLGRRRNAAPAVLAQRAEDDLWDRALPRPRAARLLEVGLQDRGE